MFVCTGITLAVFISAGTCPEMRERFNTCSRGSINTGAALFINLGPIPSAL